MPARLTSRLRAAAGLALVLGGAAACSPDSLVGLNENPNNPTVAPPGPLFTNASTTAVTRFRGANFDLTFASLFAQHIAKVQYVDEDRYELRTATVNGWFTGPYASELIDLRKVEQQGVADSRPGISAPATTMQSWVFGILTDTWGDIPYTQALRGDSAGGSVTPAYDAQKTVYEGLFATLGKASTDLEGAANTLGAADPIYQGAPLKWQRLANSLRARYALRVINRDPQVAAQQLQAAIQGKGGLMASNADNAQLAWPGDGVNDNPWSVNFQTRDDHRVSKILTDTLLAYGDPRLAVYAQPTPANAAVYAGLQNGLLTDAATPQIRTTSRPGAIFYSGRTSYGTFGNATNARTPSYLMTYAEVQFILAEAAERGIAGLTAGQARGYYEAGIRASMEQWGATGDVAAYLARPGIAYQPGATGLRQIALQKWIALYTQGSEAWSEFRRTGVPALRPGPGVTVTNAVPRRVQYAIDEQSRNSASLREAVARQGADEFTTCVWWDTACGR